MRLITLLLLCSLAPLSMGMGVKIPKATVTFHVEGGKNDNPKMVFPYPAPGGTKYFNRLPVAPTKDLVSYRPFPADDGSIGAVFQFSQTGSNRVAAITTEARGKFLMAVINGRPTNVVLIDQPVRDGIIVVWTGLKQRDVDLIDMEIPRTGATKQERAALKKEVKARLKRQLETEKKNRKKKKS